MKQTNEIRTLISELEYFGVPKIYQTKQLFVRAEQVPKKIGIIKQGLFRYYYLTSEGKEHTKVFMTQGDVVNSYTAMVSNSPSYFFIEAIEDSMVIEIKYDQWVKIRNNDNKWDKLLIAFLEKGYAMKEKREREFLQLSAENRYKQFLKDYPDLKNRVKQHMIASYLGITPIALSRIRKKM